MHPFFSAALEANRAVARRIAGGLSAAQQFRSTVGAGGDISSGIDLEAEAIFSEHLGPFGTIVSEESGSIGSGDHTILLDPIDGSSNLLAGFPYYGTSAALIDPEGTTVAASVCNLAAGEIFFKERGQPPLHGKLSDKTFISYTSVPDPEIGLFERAYTCPDAVRLLGEMDLKFRAPGAVALSLVYTLQARYFLYVGEQRAYDFAAGLLFCESLPQVQTSQAVVIAQERELVDAIVTGLGID